MARSNSKSRAQVVRERRKKARQPVKSERGGRETTSRSMPPVMVRGGYVSTPAKKNRRGRKPVKRRYDIAMATPGVEIRLPSVPAVQVGWRLASLILTLGLVVLLYFMWNSPTFQVQAAEVRGAVRLTENEINRVLNVYNKPVFTLNPVELEENLQFVFPELKDVMIQVGMPATVIVNVDERVPLVAWQGADGLKWIDAEGVGFPPRGEESSLVSVQAYANPPMPAQRLEEEPNVTAFAAPTAFLPPDLVAAILTLGPQSPEESPLVYDPRHGLGWHDVRGWDVYFGMEVAALEEKLLVYDAIVENLQAQGITPALINVEHVHAPFYRLSR